MTTLEKILTKYFTEEQASEIKSFADSIAENKGLGSSLDDYSKEQLAAEDSESFYNVSVHSLITYADSKLTKLKLIEFLLYIGEDAISHGELKAAVEIYNHLLFKVKGDPKLDNVTANSLLALGNIHSNQAEWKKSLDCIVKALRIFRKYNDNRGIANCDNLLGTIYGERGSLAKAKLHFEKSLTNLDSKKDKVLIGKIEINLGILSNIRGEFDQAFNYYQRALVKYEQAKELRRIAEVRHNLGMLYMHKGENGRALKEFNESISVSLNSGFLPALGLSYISKASIFTEQKDFLLANAFANRAMEICSKINDRLSVADIYKVKGIIERSLKNYELSANYLFTSLRLNEELENKLNKAETCYELGILYTELNKPKEKAKYLEIALKLFKNLNVVSKVEKIKKMLSDSDKDAAAKTNPSSGEDLSLA